MEAKKAVGVLLLIALIAGCGYVAHFKRTQGHYPWEPKKEKGAGLILDGHIILRYPDGTEKKIDVPEEPEQVKGMMWIYDGGIESIGFNWEVKAVVTKNGNAITTPVAFDVSMSVRDKTGKTYESKSKSKTFDSGKWRSFSTFVSKTDLPKRSLTLSGRITVKAHTTQLPVTLRNSASDTITKDVTATEYGMSVKIS